MSFVRWSLSLLALLVLPGCRRPAGPDGEPAVALGAVPAVALWVPFNVTVRDKVPGAIKLADASAYYPQAAIIGGWAAANSARRARVRRRAR